MKRIFSSLLLVSSIAYMAIIIFHQWNKIKAIDWKINTYLLCISLIGIIFAMFLNSLGWHLILKSLEQDIKISHSIRIWLVSSVTRYLPGGVWPYVSRVSLAKDQGVNIGVSSISLYIEALLLVTSSLAVGLPSFIGGADVYITPKSALVTMAIFGLLMHPKVITLIKYFPGKIGKSMINVKIPDIKYLITLYIFYLLFWIFISASFLCFVYSFYPIHIEYWIQIGTALSLAFSIGFILVIFPSGIGVRETMLYVLMIGVLPSGICLTVSVGSRIWIMFGEVISIAIFFVQQKYFKKIQELLWRNHRKMNR